MAKRAIALANANANALAFAKPNPYPYALAYANVIAYANANANANANAIANANAFANTDGIPYVKAYASAYGIPYISAITSANVYTYTNVYANVYANAITEAITYTRQLEELKVFKNIDFSALIARLEVLKAKVPDNKQPKEVRPAFAKQILQTLLKAFHLSPELVNLSEEEAQAWKNYFYANYLMVQCKEAAVRVSPKTWEAIEERMLLVPNN